MRCSCSPIRRSAGRQSSVRLALPLPGLLFRDGEADYGFPSLRLHIAGSMVIVVSMSVMHSSKQGFKSTDLDPFVTSSAISGSD
jgi:hypothetical protein